MASDALQRTRDLARDQADALAAWLGPPGPVLRLAPGTAPLSESLTRVPPGALIAMEHVDLRPLAALGPVFAELAAVDPTSSLAEALAHVAEPVLTQRDPGPPASWAPFVVATLRRLRMPLLVAGAADERAIRDAIDHLEHLTHASVAPAVSLARGRYHGPR